jgi:hypothetical protein
MKHVGTLSTLPVCDRFAEARCKDGETYPAPLGHADREEPRCSRASCSRQFGRASAPIILQRVHTMRGPNVGTGA